MTPQEQVDMINGHGIGTEVVYWPWRAKGETIIYKDGKRTKIKGRAFLFGGVPMAYVEKIYGLVPAGQVEVGRLLLDKDNPCFCDTFKHLW